MGSFYLVNTFDNAEEHDLRFWWWTPSIPNERFYIPVKAPDDALTLMIAFREYDGFTGKDVDKATGGLEVFHDGTWVDWQDDKGRLIEDRFEDDEFSIEEEPDQEED